MIAHIWKLQVHLSHFEVVEAPVRIDQFIADATKSVLGKVVHWYQQRQNVKWFLRHFLVKKREEKDRTQHYIWKSYKMPVKYYEMCCDLKTRKRSCVLHHISGLLKHLYVTPTWKNLYFSWEIRLTTNPLSATIYLHSSYHVVARPAEEHCVVLFYSRQVMGPSDFCWNV